MLRPDFISDLRCVTEALGSAPGAPNDQFTVAELEDLGTRLQAAYIDATRAIRARLVQHLEAVPDSPLRGPVSLFRAIGMHRQETIHTNALAWLFDLAQPHGFGAALFHCLVRAAMESADEGPRGRVRIIPAHAGNTRM